MSREAQSLNPGGRNLFAGGSFVGRDPTGKQTGLRLMRSQGLA